MQGSRLRALVLAAGLGTRLRPLTDIAPKPLLPVAGLPILGHTLQQLAAAGCEAAAVNLHHRGDQIRERFGDTFGGMPLVYSEEPELLGTLGALHPLKSFLVGADMILLINGDSLCRWPLRKLIKRYQADGAQATLLLTATAPVAQFGGGVGIDREGRILSFRPSDAVPGEIRRYVFAGAHVFSPKLLDRVKPGVSDIVRDLYMPMLKGGAKLTSLVTTRLWHDLGTPQRFLDAVIDWSRAGWPERLWRRAWVSPEAVIESGAKVRHAAVEAGAKVGEGAHVERAVLMPGSKVGKGSVVRESILGFGAAVPPGTWVERRVIMPQREGFALGVDDSVVGGAVFTPFG
ncbi:MAG TPA: NDP-sugar synthase [Thermoanaerobaculia bacterium]|jgi:mannose-1-phosphate guanylyltransferase|nr:NDP-sugar synthase [Thermoanaerobaculia bacterium]